MLEAVKNFLASRFAKEVIRLIAAALAGYAASGCSVWDLAKTEHPSLGVLECKAAVLKPYVADAADEVVRSIDGDRAFDVLGFLQAQGLSIDEIVEVAKAYSACSPDHENPPAPAAVAPLTRA
jgi:hypothetical protein